MTFIFQQTAAAVKRISLILAFALAAGQAQANAKPNCSGVVLPVSIVAGGAKTYSLYGELCHPQEQPSSVLQILVHGYTYDHRYWAFPGFGDAYDYVKTANEAGYSTFAVDRLGSAGASSRPLSALLTLQAHATALHDAVAAARGGALAGGPYETVLTVGHSLGTAISWIEASMFDDVDGIVSTGFGHPVGSLQGLLLNTVPAVLDNRLRPLVGLDIGYLTTAPGSRDDLFYRTATSDPAVIAYDEQTKGLGTAAELSTLLFAELATLDIGVPVLFVMGEYDNIFCIQASIGGFVNCASDATLDASERAYFPHVADFEAYVLPGAGHNINVHDNAVEWFERAADWAAQRFPPE